MTLRLFLIKQMQFFILLISISFLITNISFSRTDLNTEELKKLNKVLKLTTKFDKAERSEALSGGSGTVSKSEKCFLIILLL